MKYFWDENLPCTVGNCDIFRDSFRYTSVGRKTLYSDGPTNDDEELLFWFYH